MHRKIQKQAHYTTPQAALPSKTYTWPTLHKRMFKPLALPVLIGALLYMGYTLAGQTAQAQTLNPPHEWSASPADAHQETPSIWQMSPEEFEAWRAAFDVPPEPPVQIAEEQAARLAAFFASPHRLYLPNSQRLTQLSIRLGYGIGLPARLRDKPAAADLKAGWYQNWTVQAAPDTPNNITYVQTVRLHQGLECESGSDYNRVRCPYSVPHSYSVSPSQSIIQQVAAARPGSLWLIGNEMDRVDWGDPNAPGGPTFGRQDEMLPQLYAQAYHELYYLIKEVDHSAKIAIGGIIQPTPARLQYLDIVWDTYRERYGQDMPVDVWNTHNFMIREGNHSINEWGAGIPPGVNLMQGEFVGVRDANGDRTYHIDMQIFDQQIRAFRQWMKDRGQQEKPLIVTEYGVLYPNNAIFLNCQLHYSSCDEDRVFIYDTAEPVVDFMLATFHYFMNERDCDLGFTADDCLLVQAWNWFILNEELNSGYNRHGALINVNGQLTPAGEAFRNFSNTNLRTLARPYPIP